MAKYKSILAFVSMAAVLLGVLFKFMHFPGAGVLLIVGGSSLAMSALFASGLVQARFGKSSQSGGGKILKKEGFLAMAASVLTIGLLYFTLLWPGARIMLQVGSGAVVVGMLLYGYAHFVKREKVKITWTAIYITVGILALFLAATSTADRIAEYQKTQQNTFQE